MTNETGMHISDQLCVELQKLRGAKEEGKSTRCMPTIIFLKLLFAKHCIKCCERCHLLKGSVCKKIHISVCESVRVCVYVCVREKIGSKSEALANWIIILNASELRDRNVSFLLVMFKDETISWEGENLIYTMKDK